MKIRAPVTLWSKDKMTVSDEGETADLCISLKFETWEKGVWGCYHQKCTQSSLDFRFGHTLELNTYTFSCQ